jgi:hypothetical protein
MGDENSLAEDEVLVDFHAHTSWSDGELPVPKLVRAAEEGGILEIALTDHDDYRALSTSNIEAQRGELEAPGLQYESPGVYRYKDTRVVRGIELTCRDGAKNVHILGLYLDEPDQKVRDMLDKVRGVRRDRIQTVIANVNLHRGLIEKGIRLDVSDVLENIVGDGVASRLHVGFAISGALKEKGYHMSPGEAMDTYIGKKSMGTAYVRIDSTDVLEPKDCIKMILSMHGLPILPHPRELEKVGFGIMEKLEEYAGYGLAGVEMTTGRVPQEDRASFAQWIKSHVEGYEAGGAKGLRATIPDHMGAMRGLDGMPLLYTAGWDYHGGYYPDRSLGMPMKVRELERIKEARRQIIRPVA